MSYCAAHGFDQNVCPYCEQNAAIVEQAASVKRNIAERRNCKPVAPPDAQPAPKKNDSGKPRWSLLDVGAITELVKVLTAGGDQYGDENWRSFDPAIARDKYYNAAMRHFAAWRGGEARDPQWGFHHLGHALASTMFLLAFDLASEAKKP